MRGRKPTPTNLKLVKGTGRADRINAAEPKPMPALPQPPSHLNDHALEEWERVCLELYNLGILSELDRAALAAYCQAYGRWVTAENALEKMAERDGAAGALVIKTKSGNIIQNPLVGTANKAMADMLKYAAEFGMTPSARTRISAMERGDMTDDPAAKYGF